MPLCIKGEFYTKAVIVYVTTAFDATGFGVKSPCEESWPPSQKLIIHKGKFLRQQAKLVGLPQMCLIDRAYPIQVTASQIGNIKWRKVIPLCSLHKEKVLRRQAPLTGFQPNHVLWHKIFPLCIHTMGKFYTVRSYISYKVGGGQAGLDYNQHEYIQAAMQ